MRIFRNHKDHTMKILIVEDSAVDRVIAQKLISKIGWESETAKTGLEATDLLLQNEYALVLMDINISGKSGMEIIKEIRNNDGSYFKQLPVYALTASSPTMQKELLDIGFNGMLSKPLKSEDLKNLELNDNSMVEVEEKALAEKIDGLCDGDLDFKEKLVASFIGLFEEIMVTMKKALKEKDVKMARSIRHKAMSTIKMLDLEELNSILFTGIFYLEESNETLPNHYQKDLKSLLNSYIQILNK